MADRPSYPDSTGSRWGAAPGGRRSESADRPPFLERTEPLSAGDQTGAPGGLTAEPRDRTVPGGDAPDQQSRLGAPPPRSRQDGTAPQWSTGTDVAPESSYLDPELAAAAGLETARPADPAAFPRSAPPQAPAQSMPPPVVSAPQSAPPQQHPQHSMPTAGPIDEPTRLHNPVPPPAVQQAQPQDPRYTESFDRGQSRRGYPEQVGDGVYRRSRPGLGVLVGVATLALAGLFGYMLFEALTAEGPVSPSAVVSAGLALAGLPLAAWGITPLLGTGSNSGPDDISAVLRAPYVYLVTGLVLLLAAGLAA